MVINILAFGIAKDIVGGTSLSISIGDTRTVKHLRQALETRYLEFSKLSSYMIAVNNSYANDEQFISENDEIAIIPPVSGG